MRLETKYAEVIIGLLEDAQDVGLPHVVLELRPQDMELQPHQLSLFETLGEALDYLDGAHYLSGDAEFPVYYRHADQLLEEIKKSNPLTIKKADMNRNNLENLKEEMKALGFKDKLIAEMQQKMEANVPQFMLHDTIAGNKGIVNLSVPLKQSGQSEHYYLNKYEVSLDKGGKMLEPGQQYMVIAKGEENKFRNFQDPHQAIEYFKEKKGDAELAVGKDLKNKTLLATMENDKVNYVVKDFQRTFNNPAVTQTFYVESGKGFTAEQAANLIQGRAVYRDDLANAAGMSYKAWVLLDLNNPKDRHGNFLSKHYHDPSYGFDLGKVLDNFNIRELNDPAKREKLEESLRQGNRPLVTVNKDGEEMKLHLETSPRYSQINLFQENGKPEKREQFLKPELSQAMLAGKGKEQVKEQQQEQGIAV
ncbi:hypothetical protein [Mucilaginibacter phenanthrenivorans]|uniref:hypothetical protein n=1 Tax=Mucilaginibacter phenanthrenivorans TaxID=1234842 RepID=UPI002157BC87|nr:hypothetical protein [Mucilaginibacter phenanthrenivorans]